VVNTFALEITLECGIAIRTPGPPAWFAPWKKRVRKP